ncbi:MAG: DegT/DnrJ/EryC1/StrS family aminotransferase [Candidatus Staskawiczbacteria bacterium]|nr:DegT/DnrJ/EryC1/StrS family aminotransferase [Candidatus Staskawiczbacteria bacterium]
MSYFRPISISLSPNVEKDDLHLALNLIIRPWLWKNPPSRKASARQGGKAISELEDEFKKYLEVKYAFSFNSGRSSFFAILKALSEVEGLKSGGEVLLQAFTCNAVPNPVLWAGLKPVYVDCRKDDFNMDAEDLKSKITTMSRVVVVQHTFGLPANMDEIRSICGVNNLILIEDCAHSLGAEYNGIKVGSHSKASFFSFSRDKIISSVYGGIAVTNDDKVAESLQQAQAEFEMPSSFWIFQQLLHPILLHYIILPIYNFLDLGKIFLVLSQWFHILSKAVSWQEKRGERPDYFPKALPNALAVLALNQFNKLEKFNAHRQKIANYYFEELKDTKFRLPQKFSDRKNVFLRFTANHPKAQEIIYEAWHDQNILLGDWYTTPIAPFDTKIEEIGYKLGMCPIAERLSKETLNLPTHINISQKDASRIVDFLKRLDI